VAVTATMQVVDEQTGAVVRTVEARRPGLALLGSLARLQLSALRRGSTLRLRGASEELLALLELVGLSDVLPLEARRKAEGGEQLGVEEVVQPDDPPA